MSKNNISKPRVIFCIIIVYILFGIMGARLGEFQLVKGEEFLLKADQRVVAKIDIPAIRGEIVDEKGEQLATSKKQYRLLIDKSFVEKDNENLLIAELIKLFSGHGKKWNNSMPITKKQPYDFKGSEQQNNQVKELLGLSSYATAENCMQEIIKKAEIKGFSDKMTANIARIRYQMIAEEYEINNRYIFVEKLTKKMRKMLESDKKRFKGILIEKYYVRDYVSGTIAPHLIGSVGPLYAEEYKKLKGKGYAMNAIVGKDGLEKAMDLELRGTSGTLQVTENMQGDIVKSSVTKNPASGNTVVLTIDKRFQEKVETILKEQVHSDGKDSGAIVVLDTKNGNVLAAATYPTYNINDLKSDYKTLREQGGTPLYNRALFGEYRPGSTYKTAVATAALSEGLITKYSSVYCNRTYHHYTGYSPTCTGTHHSINVVPALKWSCNIFFYDVGRRLGIDKINKYSKKLGLGSNSGLEIGNSKGALASPRRTADLGGTWREGDVVQASIGQSENAVTPLQMAVQAMTIANKGVRYKLNLIKRIESSEGEVIKKTKKKVLSKIQDKNDTFSLVREGMEEAGSRVWELAKYPFKVAIKTGTPQRTEDTYNSSVIGFAPSEQPRIAISAMIEQGKYAKQVVGKVIDAYYEVYGERE